MPKLTFGVSMVRDEADIVYATVRNMLAHVDAVIVADNGSTDGTRDILAGMVADGAPVTIVDDPEPAYLQSDKMTRLAHLAGEAGAEWVVPFDADEWWYATGRRMGDVLSEMGDGMMVASAGLYDHVATGVDNPDRVNPVLRMRWRRREALPLPKVACRYRPSLRIHQGNHGCDYDGIIPAFEPILVVRHFPYRSVDQFVRKVRNGAAAYQAAGDRLPADAGAHWRQWGALLDEHGVEAVEAIFRTWYYRAAPGEREYIGGETHRPLIEDPAPGS